MRRFAALYRELDARSGTGARVEALAAYFASADPAAQKTLLDEIAFKGKIGPGLEKPAEFFNRFRSLTLGAYYTTTEGWAEIGYVGNQPGTGDYPGPTPEAAAHIKGVIEGMGLKYTAP